MRHWFLDSALDTHTAPRSNSDDVCSTHLIRPGEPSASGPGRPCRRGLQVVPSSRSIGALRIENATYGLHPGYSQQCTLTPAPSPLLAPVHPSVQLCSYLSLRPLAQTQRSQFCPWHTLPYHLSQPLISCTLAKALSFCSFQGSR